MKTQLQHYEAARKQSAECNLLFLEFVRDGLTGKELTRLIEHRPELWDRYSHWIDKLGDVTEIPK